MALVPSPQWLDTGDNAWQLAAGTFVALQSIPGLTVLYGGIVKKKWAINSAFMSMYAFASVLDRLGSVRLQHGVRRSMAVVHAGQTFLGTPGMATSAAFHIRPSDNSGRRSGYAADGLPDVDADVLPVRVRRDHGHHSCRIGSGPHELHGVDDLLPGVDDAGLHGGRVQHLGRRLARRLGVWLTSPAATSSIWPQLSSGFVAAAVVGPRLQADRDQFPAEQPADHPRRCRHPVAGLERLQRRRSRTSPMPTPARPCSTPTPRPPSRCWSGR